MKNRLNALEQFRMHDKFFSLIENGSKKDIEMLKNMI